MFERGGRGDRPSKKRKKRKERERNEIKRIHSGRVFWTRAKGSLLLALSIPGPRSAEERGERSLIMERGEKLTTANRTCAIRNVQFLQFFVRQRELPQDLVAIRPDAYAELLQQRHPLQLFDHFRRVLFVVRHLRRKDRNSRIKNEGNRSNRDAPLSTFNLRTAQSIATLDPFIDLISMHLFQRILNEY